MKRRVIQFIGSAVVTVIATTGCSRKPEEATPVPPVVTDTTSSKNTSSKADNSSRSQPPPPEPKAAPPLRNIDLPPSPVTNENPPADEGYGKAGGRKGTKVPTEPGTTEKPATKEPPNP